MLGKRATYETDKIKFTQPAKDRTYTPDWKIRDGVYIETKGKLTREDRAKHLWVKEQHPEITVYFLFQNAFNKLDKRSKTTYAAWAEANGFEWSDEKLGIPEKWFEN